MSNEEVSISFGGDTAAFESACQRAHTAMQALTASVTAMTGSLTQVTQGLNTATPATTALTAAVTQANTAAKTSTASLLDLVNATTGVTAAARSAADSADVFRVALGDQSNEVKALRAQFDETTPAAHRTAHASGGITRELLVLGHEAMMGNFSRFGGSLIVMAELMGNVSIKMIAMGGAIALAGIGVYHLIENFRAAAHEAEALNMQMVLMGRDPEAATAAATALANQLHQTGSIGSSEAHKIADAFMRLHGTTDELRAGLARMVPELAAATSTETVDKVAEAFARASQSVHGIKRLFEENDLFGSAAEREAIDGFTRTNNLVGAQTLLLERLQARFGDYGRAQREQAAAARDANIAGLPGIELPQPAPLKMTDQARSPQDAQLDEQQAKLNGHKAEEVQLDETIMGLRQRLAQTSDAAAKRDVESALKVATERRAQMHEAGDTSWAQKQEEALTKETAVAVQSATTSRAATEAKLTTEVNFWQRATQSADLSASQRATAETRLARATTQLTEERLRAHEAADRGAATSMRKSVQEQISELAAQQAANRDDYQTWASLEGQKLAILRTAYGEKSREFQAELKAEETYQREHQAKLEQQEMQSLERRNSLGQKQLAQKVADLDAEGTAQGRTKLEELATEQRITQAEGAIEVKRFDDFVATLTKGTTEYQKALEQRENLAQQFQTRLAVINKRIAEEEKRSTDRSLAEYTSVFGRIGSSAESMTSGLVSRTMTWQRAEQQAANTIMQSMTQLVGHQLARWAAMEIGKTLTSQQQQAIRDAQADGGTGLAVIGRLLAQWLGLETEKTAATGAQSAARTGIAATAEGAGAVDSALSAISQIKASAAAAGAAAYAAIAGIPVVGPELAPEAAATAFIGASSFAAAVAVPSFAVGAWNLPSDMLAQVHKGEMIVPAFQAEAARNGGLGGGGGGLTVHLSAIDTQSGAAFLKQIMPTLAKQYQQHIRLNPSAKA